MRVSTASRKLHFSDVFNGLYFQLPESKTWLNPVEMHIRKERKWNICVWGEGLGDLLK